MVTVNLTGSRGCQAYNLHYSLPCGSEAGRVLTYLLLPIQEITGSESSDVAGFRRYVLEQVRSAKQRSKAILQESMRLDPDRHEFTLLLFQNLQRLNFYEPQFLHL